MNLRVLYPVKCPFGNPPEADYLTGFTLLNNLASQD